MEGFTGEDGEVDFDLVEPGRVDRSVDHDRVRVSLLQPDLSGHTSVRRAVVHDPEHTPSRRVGFGCHHVIDQSGERLDPGGRIGDAQDLA
ncbi:hypothetical protein SDC9_166883 [bioreactor metagenome]|uniref:Uncharacterized protein n=1 Tax=bioreactor metagenome TaxID=1076179 RepID=A0A645G0P7_9ZZZZ